MDESKFDPYNDAEGLIRLGAFSHVRMFHALRSLSWMISRYTDWEDRSVKDISFEDLQAMGKLITKRNYLNYDGQTGYINLCNHYDWHVFYVPEKYMKSKYARNNDLRYLTGKENRGGNTTTFFMSGMGADQLRAMNRKNKIIGRNEETLESLEGLRKDLRALLPIMQTIHDHLLEGRDRSKKLEGPLADALTAWCALAIAAKEPFYSEEAADTPEADAALEEPLERPTDKLDDKPTKKAKSEPKKDEKKETPKKSPAKQASKAGKAMKGASNDASYEQYLPKGTKLTPEETRYMTIIARLLTEKKKVNINDIAFETNETIEETKKVLLELRKKEILNLTSYGNLEMWEPERRKKAEAAAPAAKKTGSRTETFYKRFTFELPDGYDLERENDQRCVFYLNEHDDGNGTLVYDYLNTMTLEKFTDLEPGESPIQRIRDSFYTKEWYEISGEPKSGIMTEQGLFFRAGDPVDTYSMMYLYQLSDTEALVFREKVMEGKKRDLSYHLDKYEHFLQAIGNICVDGKPVPAAGITAAELWDKVRAYRDVNYEEPGESRKKEEKKIKTKPAAKPEKIEKYNEMFGFAFPAGYEMRWETGEDGDRKCWIQYGSYYKDNGEKEYRFKALLSENQPADPLPGERPIQALKRINQDAIFSSVSTDPKAELMVKATPLNILGRIVNLYAVWLIVEKNAREYFLVNCIGTWDEDHEKQLEYYRCMIDVTNALRVNGKPLPQLTESPENLMRKMPPIFDENTRTLRGNVNVEVSVNGSTVSSSTVYGDNAGNIHSRKRYTADMMPPGTDNPEKMAEELNDMDPEQAEKMLNLLIGMNELNDALSDLNDTVSGKKKEPTTEQKTVNSRPVQTTNKSTQTTNGNVRIMDFGGATILDGMDYMADTDPRPMVIPEGVTQIGDSYFSHCHMESVTLPSTMRILGHHVFSNCSNLKKVELNEGLEKIDGLVFADSPLMTEITLPDSIRWIDNDAFLVEFSVSNPRSNMTVRLSGNLARYLVRNNEYPDIPAIRAKEFIIEGRSYRSLEDYVRKPGSGKPVKTESPGRNAPPSQETDEQKQQRRDAILKQIKDLETERDAAKGLFSGFKKNKLQKRIDELKEKLRQL